MEKPIFNAQMSRQLIKMRSVDLYENLSVLGLSLIHDLKTWFNHLLETTSKSIWMKWDSFQGYVAAISGRILLILKSSGKWILLAPVKLIRWLWRVSRLGSGLARAMTSIVMVLKWTVIVVTIAAVGGLLLTVSVTMYQKHRNPRESLLPHLRGGRSYGTFGEPMQDGSSWDWRRLISRIWSMTPAGKREAERLVRSLYLLSIPFLD